jgi:hypothetical protein
VEIWLLRSNAHLRRPRRADCRDHRCSLHITVSADRWPDHVRLSDIEPDFVCTACGKAWRGGAAEIFERADGTG